MGGGETVQSGRTNTSLKRENNKRGNFKREDNKKGSFLVNICCCENATWQGYVVWAEKNQKEYFRSALELIFLIDGALGEVEIESEGANAIMESIASSSR